MELGGFLFTFIGDGNPGTGKTSLIQMIAGLVKGYCDVAGYGFQYENFGIDQISEYQGKSGQNCRAFIERVLDPRSIGFGTIDDVDMVAGKRDDQRASGGQQEVTAVLMEAFSGPNTVVRGNCAFGMFSNYPEKVDDALRQRAGARWTVDGPQTRADYIDILHLLLGKNHKIPLGAARALRRAGTEEDGRRELRGILGAAGGEAQGRVGAHGRRKARPRRSRMSAPICTRSRRSSRASPAARSRTSPIRSNTVRWTSTFPMNGLQRRSHFCGSPTT